MRSEDHSSRKGRKKEVHPLLFPSPEEEASQKSDLQTRDSPKCEGKNSRKKPKQVWRAFNVPPRCTKRHD